MTVHSLIVSTLRSLDDALGTARQVRPVSPSTDREKRSEWIRSRDPAERMHELGENRLMLYRECCAALQPRSHRLSWLVQNKRKKRNPKGFEQQSFRARQFRHSHNRLMAR